MIRFSYQLCANRLKKRPQPLCYLAGLRATISCKMTANAMRQVVHMRHLSLGMEVRPGLSLVSRCKMLFCKCEHTRTEQQSPQKRQKTCREGLPGPASMLHCYMFGHVVAVCELLLIRSECQRSRTVQNKNLVHPYFPLRTANPGRVNPFRHTACQDFVELAGSSNASRSVC